jgi:hypothetical protein
LECGCVAAIGKEVERQKKNCIDAAGKAPRTVWMLSTKSFDGDNVTSGSSGAELYVKASDSSNGQQHSVQLHKICSTLKEDGDYFLS